MSEQLLKAIIQLFAIVAKEGSVTYSERLTIKEFLERQLNQEGVTKYMELFDQLVLERESEKVQIENTDPETVDFVEDWSNIIQITRQLNREITKQQKVVLILKMMELITADKVVSEREANLLYYISDALKLQKETVQNIRSFVDFQNDQPVISPNLLIIDDGNLPIPEDLSHMVASGLQGQLVVLRLPSIESYYIKYLGRAAVYLNGVPLKNNKGVVFSTGSTIRAYRTEPIYYSDVVGKFLTSKTLQKIVFRAESISYKFPDGVLGLRNISIFEESGKLIGIMGSSGSGKSTLLNVLNGHLVPSQGEVLINQVNIHEQAEQIEGIIGYIPQDDFLIEDLTVYENLFYAGRLCFGDASVEEIDNLVTKTLSSLGLTQIRDLKVGTPLEKIISGGQRKRVNVGLELLREPQILFVDEPTSGLSSRDSENIMDLLKELSLKGKLIFVVIHQPSSDIFKMFDRLVILDVGGYQIYYGNPVEAESYFKDIVNLIDKDLGQCPVCGNIRPEEIFNIIETKVVDEFGRLTEKRKVSPLQWEEHFSYRSILPVVPTVNDRPEGRLNIPGRLKQFWVFTQRDVRAKLSDLQYILINSLEAPLLGFILAFIVKQFPAGPDTSYVFGSNVNIPAFFFMSVIVALFMGLTVSAEEIIKDRKILKRERYLHLSRGSYLFSKITILFAISAFQSCLFALIGCFILEVKGMFLAFWVTLFSTACFANVLGLNVSSAFRSAVTVYILIPILLIPQLVLGGVVVKFDDLHPSLRSPDKVPMVGEVMTSRWAYEAIMVHQFKGNRYGKPIFESDQKMFNAQFKTIYLIPTLESKIRACKRMLQEGSTEELAQNLKLLQHEIGKELLPLGEHRFSNWIHINGESVSEEVLDEAAEFLRVLKQFYNRKINQAQRERRAELAQLEKDQGRAVNELKSDYFNNSINDIVKNITTTDRIIEVDDRLIQKIYPIYIWPNNSKLLNFRTQFYVAHKPFFGAYMQTFYFNMLVIWFMSFGLFLLLYFDVLGRLFLPKK